MSDAERSSRGSDSDGSGGGRRPMVGFLFGNVNSKMQLQDDYLEEASLASSHALQHHRRSTRHWLCLTLTAYKPAAWHDAAARYKSAT